MKQIEDCTCGYLAEKIIVPPLVMPDLPGYDCPITGKWIEGRRAHEENLKRQGCRVYEAGETREFIKNRDKRHEEATNALLDRILPRSLGDHLGR
jgi:hypothetical protein